MRALKSFRIVVSSRPAQEERRRAHSARKAHAALRRTLAEA